MLWRRGEVTKQSLLEVGFDVFQRGEFDKKRIEQK